MAQARVSILSGDERDSLHEQTLAVLSEVGVAFNSAAAIDLLADAGAPVDRERLAARIPADLVARCLELAPAQVLLAARDPAHDVLVGDAGLSFTTDGTATYVIDDETGTRVEGTAAHLSTIMRLFDALPNIDYVWPTISARDLDPVVANLEIQAISFRSCTKHVQDEVRSPEFVAPLLEIIAAVAGAPARERPVFSAIDCTVAPLQHDAAMTEAGIALARAGVPIVIMPMPLMGTTAPMSVAGTVVMTMAELLSAVVLFQLAAPGCPLIASPEPAVSDLRTGLYLCGAPEADLCSLAAVEMCRWYGLPVQGPGFGGDAKAADYQEAAEGIAVAVQAAMLGADSLVGIGTLDGAQATSLAKIVLDDEAAAMVRRLVAATPMAAVDALLDDIREVGPGGHFLARRSTRQRARADGLWQPRLFRRGSFESHAGTSLVDDALARARELLASHEVTPLADDVERDLDEVIAAHRRSQA